MKKCKQCNKEFPIKGKKSFCSYDCQQQYWAIKRNKTGTSSKKTRLFGQKARLINPTSRQMEIILGMMMGDSSITQRENGTCRLRLCHGEKQKDYLEWKRNELKEFISQNTPTKNEGISFGSPSTSFVYETVVHPIFQKLYPNFYVRYGGIKRRTFNMNILNKLTPLSILIWFLDDGCYCYTPQNSSYKLYLSTCRYTLSEIRMAKKWFWHTWRIESVIYYDKTHNTHYLNFRRAAQFQFNDLFLKPFKDQIPSCMSYKFPNF